MKYYVISDPHGFCKETMTALKEAGFFGDPTPHKLIVCGDMMDRGREPENMDAFMTTLLYIGKLIFIRGNHEDLMLSMLHQFCVDRDSIAGGYSHHVSNGTWDTALQLAGMTAGQAFCHPDDFVKLAGESLFVSELIPASVNYFETEHYIFVHGWIPCVTEDMPESYRRNRHYSFDPGWRTASDKAWGAASWFNGMELAKEHGIVVPGKTIVCGHWHTSFGHARYENKGTEFGDDADFSVYKSDGIIALDACTAHSGKVNCIVIED